MKKFFAVCLSVMLLCSAFVFSSTAAINHESEIVPLYNNAKSASVSLTISSTGKATIKLNCTGIADVTSKMTAVTYIQRKVGLIWVKVDNGLSGKEWTDTVYTTTLSKTHTLQLSQTGNYRVKTTFTVKGTAGATDEIDRTDTATY